MFQAHIQMMTIVHTTFHAAYGVLSGCYVLVERSARLELDGYDSVVWHVALEACASSTL